MGFHTGECPFEGCDETSVTWEDVQVLDDTVTFHIDCPNAGNNNDEHGWTYTADGLEYPLEPYIGIPITEFTR